MPDKLIDALYTNLILRDVFGKIGPGFIVLITLVVALEPPTSPYKDAYDFFAGLPTGGWVAVLATAWIIGFAVQSIGEIPLCGRHLIRYFPKDVEEKDWRKMTATFRSRSDHGRHKLGYERLVVIKEACGNTYVALSLATALFTADYLLEKNNKIQPLDDLVQGLPVYVLDALIILSLARMHFAHVERQHNFLKSVLDQPETAPPDPNVTA